MQEAIAQSLPKRIALMVQEALTADIASTPDISFYQGVWQISSCSHRNCF